MRTLSGFGGSSSESCVRNYPSQPQGCTRASFKKIARDIKRCTRPCPVTKGHAFERMRLRGLTGARDEFHLAAIVHNLKRMALRLLGPSKGSPRSDCVRGLSFIAALADGDAMSR
jgi:hypothetical protein